jgi:hypothetical protein
VIAWSAWHGGLVIVAIAALALGVWMGGMAISALRRRG